MTESRCHLLWCCIPLVALLGTSCSGCRGNTPSEPHPLTSEPVGPVVDGWTESGIDDVSCTHPAVIEDCKDGWCKIPAGCFIMGSPETEPERGMYTEPETAVTLTHAFEIQQFEMTQKQWTALGLDNPSGPASEISDCIESNCPVGHVSWFDAVKFANLFSEKHDLKPCYDLGECKGAIARGLYCPDVKLTAESVYDCEGYRLPTEAEWEYAARAGTRTAYYSGDMTLPEEDYRRLKNVDLVEPNLEPIAWYAANTGGFGSTTRPVGQKAPNRWGLYDMLGNVEEWTSDYPQFQDPPGPSTNPLKWSDENLNVHSRRVARGGIAIDPPNRLRSASFAYWSWELPVNPQLGNGEPDLTAGQGSGFRLVRTLR